ncbi:hypothetical protein B0J14DRAFT_673149, partial [Halenospora varia]
HMSVDIDTSWTDLILISCFLVSGIADSVAFNVWACFASMQTGNTIFVGLGVSNQPYNAAPFGWAKSLTAIVCFLIGTISFANLYRCFGVIRRSMLVCSFGLQALMISIAAILVTVGVVAGPDAIDWKELVPLALLAFQSSGQIVGSRMLKYNELPTVVITSLFCDLMSDARLFTVSMRDNPARNRRAVAAICLFVGSIYGGYLTIGWAALAGGLWIAAFLKGCMTLAFLLWK